MVLTLGQALQHLKDAVKARFDLLAAILQYRLGMRVIIAGLNSEQTRGYSGYRKYANKPGGQKVSFADPYGGKSYYWGARNHQLGCGLAPLQWINLAKENKKTHKEGIDTWLEMQSYIDECIHDLFEKFPKRIACGDITQKGPNDATNIIRVWGANVENYNSKLDEEISGSGQAKAVGLRTKNTFAIITTPLCLNEENLDKLNEADLVYLVLSQGLSTKTFSANSIRTDSQTETSITVE